MYYYYSTPNPNTIGKKLLIVLFVVLTMVAIIILINLPKDKGSGFVGSITGDSRIINAQVVGGAEVISAAQLLTPKANSGPGVGTVQIGRFPAVWQRDKNQYSSEAEWRTWAPSACSAAALASVLNGYGKNVRLTDVLAYLRDQGAIKAGAGLFRYDVFSSIADKYGLKAVYSEDRNIEAHFQQIMNYVEQGYPVVVDIQDSTYFPNGHFVVATGLNADGTVAIMNSDPAAGKPVNQNWAVESLKLYFSRVPRSTAYLPPS